MVYLTSIILSKSKHASPEQKIKELEQRIPLEREKSSCLAINRGEDKAAILDKVIELAEQEYLLPLKKNSFPDQSKPWAKKKAKP